MIQVLVRKEKKMDKNYDYFRKALKKCNYMKNIKIEMKDYKFCYEIWNESCEYYKEDKKNPTPEKEWYNNFILWCLEKYYIKKEKYSQIIRKRINKGFPMMKINKNTELWQLPNGKYIVTEELVAARLGKLVEVKEPTQKELQKLKKQLFEDNGYKEYKKKVEEYEKKLIYQKNVLLNLLMQLLPNDTFNSGRANCQIGEMENKKDFF
jgi:hypothetical protein